MRKIFYLLMVVSVMAAASWAYAEEAKSKAPVNKICPIMNAPVNPELTYEYKGKIYAVCCKGCLSAFAADPEKYVTMINDSMAQASAPKAKICPVTGKKLN